jgi:hypothetical protein
VAHGLLHLSQTLLISTYPVGQLDKQLVPDKVYPETQPVHDA